MRRLAAALALLAACGAPVGKYCKTHDDCAGLVDGYCARVEICTRQCVPGSASTKDQCPAGSACVQEGARAVCLASCAADAQCEKNFACQARPEGQVCRYLDALVEPPPVKK